MYHRYGAAREKAGEKTVIIMFCHLKSCGRVRFFLGTKKIFLCFTRVRLIEETIFGEVKKSLKNTRDHFFSPFGVY